MPQIIGESRIGDIVLPVYHHDTLVAPKGGMEAAVADTRSPRLVRAVMPFVPKSIAELKEQDRIGELLRRTEEEFSIIAKLCGSTVLDHSFGLWRPAQSRTYRDSWPSSKLCLPEDHILVAEVDVIKNAHVVAYGTAAYDQIREGLDAYGDLDRDLSIYDADYSQFITTYDEAGAHEDTVQPVYCDIEPRLRTKH